MWTRTVSSQDLGKAYARISTRMSCVITSASAVARATGWTALAPTLSPCPWEPSAAACRTSPSACSAGWPCLRHVGNLDAAELVEADRVRLAMHTNSPLMVP